jgi:hypothetical protein
MNEMHETMRNKTLEDYWDFGWDVIHFNVGLHDLKFVKDGKLDKQHGEQVNSTREYEHNLRQIINYLEQLSPQAALIFATTTPVPEGAPGHVVDDAVKYNRVALKVLQDHPEVAINDLYDLSLPNEESWRAGPGNVHFAPEGRALQGDGVARAILASLGSPDGIEIFVSPEGDDAAAGTRSDPVRTIDRALENVAPGDTVSLLGGRYSQPMTAIDVHGQNGRPVTIRSLPGGQVTFDGTDVLPGEWQEVTSDSPNGAVIQEAQWQRIGDNRVFSLSLDESIHALIYDGKLMTEARWPNARWDDPWRLDRYNVLRRATEQSTPGELFDGFPTGNTLEESSKWVHYDREARARHREMLADTRIDFTGSVVVISYAWGSFATQVTEHQAGSNSFRFDTEFTGSGSIQEEAVRFVINRIQWDNPNRFNRSSHGGIHIYFEGLPALEIPEDWWYDHNSKTLFFIAPDGQKPDASKARGKRRDYLLTVRNSSHVHVKGFEFFGAAARIEDSEYSRIEDSNFRFSAANKFTIGNFDMPVTTRIANRQPGKDEDRSHGNALVNCQFTYLDGNAFEGRSTGLAIDNVLIYRTQQTTLGLDSRSMSIDRPSLIRRVTLADVGASVGIKGGGIDSLYELNNISRFGGLQYDGAALQMGGREHIIYRYNWSHDHPKRSFRFDAGNYPAYSNAFGEMSYNVAWNTPGGFAIKGDDHLIYNNLLLGNSKFELFNMQRWASENKRTLVANNIVETMSAGINDRNPAKAAEPAEVISIRKNNYRDDPASELRDPANLDFRPRQGSVLIDAGHSISRDEVPWKRVPITGVDDIVAAQVDIGPYEYDSPVYWIPGFQYAHASTPVPPDGTTTAMSDADLMWLGAYRADTHRVYFGESEQTVRTATVDSPEFRRTFEGPANIFDPGALKPGQTYYWRVDAVRDGETSEGELWTFTVSE